jgi:hypothetical protein
MKFLRVGLIIVALLLGWAGLRAQPALVHALQTTAAIVSG